MLLLRDVDGSNLVKDMVSKQYIQKLNNLVQWRCDLLCSFPGESQTSGINFNRNWDGLILSFKMFSSLEPLDDLLLKQGLSMYTIPFLGN